MTIISQNLNTITQKITNNTMSIVIEFIANTEYEIQIWIIKTCCKLYIHKIKKPKILKAPKNQRAQNAKTPKTN
jgi:hypothetical protein